MSSNRNNQSAKKVSSIAKQLNTQLSRRKKRIYFFSNVLLFFAVFAALFIGYEYSHAGNTFYPDAQRAVTVDQQVKNTIRTSWGSGWRSHISYCTNNPQILRRLVVYRVEDSTSGLLFELPIFGLIIQGIAAFLILSLLQRILCCIRSPFEHQRIRWTLSPINDIAARADELAHMEFDDNRVRELEERITCLNPEESLPVNPNDKELESLEVAINNLLQRLRESYVQQARFVNDASHELRTPIAVIEGYSNMLARWGREDEKVLDESITAIQHESAHMKYLVEQLLFLARGDAGKTVLHPSYISLTDIMREIYEESLMIDEAHVYRFNCPEEDIKATCDPALMKQAVRILIDNAAKFTAEKNEITISVGINENARPYLQVQDEGMGMEESDIAHMFERFYRSDESRTVKGTGLGLSIAKWIIDRHNGHFETTSRVGIGTRIRIVL